MRINKMKKLSIKKKILIIVVSLFALYNIVWLTYMWIVWKPFCEVTGYNDGGFVCSEGTYETGKFNYGVSCPHYLSFTGNLSLVEVQKTKSNDDTIVLIIWPKLDGSYEVGVMVHEYEVSDFEGSTGMSEVIVTTLLLNEKMEFIEEPTPEQLNYFNEHKEHIQMIYGKMYDMWGIG